MIEAVGHQYFDEYFRKCGELLTERGTFLMQAIIIPRKREAAYRKSVDFIQRYIFPGGCLPSLSALLTSASKAGDFRLVRVDDYTADYSGHAAAWRECFWSGRAKSASSGLTKSSCARGIIISAIAKHSSPSGM